MYKATLMNVVTADLFLTRLIKVDIYDEAKILAIEWVCKNLGSPLITLGKQRKRQHQVYMRGSLVGFLTLTKLR